MVIGRQAARSTRFAAAIVLSALSPSLDDAGNSVRAQRAITGISTTLGGNVSAAAPPK